jgi:polyhydroxybutyrate depolymerase
MPVLAIHGTADPIDPYSGHGLAYWTYSVPDAAARWAAHDGCDPTPARTMPTSGVTVTAYSSCRSGATVKLYSIDGEGHEWPGGPTLPKRIARLLGRQTDAVDASAVIWSFLSAFRLR